MTGTVARIALDLSLDRFFDYRIPEKLRGQIKTGTRVNVPFGKSAFLRSGYVMEITDRSEFTELREIDSLCDNAPNLPDPLLRLAEWMALYYCCPRELAIRNLLPGAVRNGKIRHRVRPHCRLGDAAQAAEFVARNSGRSKARTALLKELMLEHELPQDVLLLKAGTGKGALDALVKLGLVIREDVVDERDPFKGSTVIPTTPLPPTPEQAEALRVIFETMDGKNDGRHVVLLHGVTCSGKTEVYLQAIARALEQGGEAIVLVPEISLTPQTVERFRARFGDRVSVLHSGLSDGERHDEWMKVHSGRVRIAVGARSALFAPFTHLKLIVVDEEHEQSYKQSEAPRYNARDVAVMRGKLEGATVILGSATPSLESHYNAITGKYAHVRMLRRSDPNIVLPEVKIIDMRCEESDDGKRPVLSTALIRAVKERISLGEQSIIFLNRRGFAKQMICEECGFVARCPDCSAAYTYHRKLGILTCHLCGAMISAYERCPQCGTDQIRYSGTGTEKVESMAFSVFKGARIARMDSDSMTRPSLYEEVLGRFRRGEIDILIGTQMIAKGLDFPNVTFVGVINADMGLFLPDFRASERTFQLLTQVAGRAGRGEHRGEVLIQTSNPFNSAITAAAEHDCDTFYADELPIREELKFPPYGHLLTLHFDGEDSSAIEQFARRLMTRIGPFLDPETEVTEPMPCPIERIKGRYRYQAVFRAGKLGRLKQALREECCRRHPKGISIYLDIDPVSML